MCWKCFLFLLEKKLDKKIYIISMQDFQMDFIHLICVWGARMLCVLFACRSQKHISQSGVFGGVAKYDRLCHTNAEWTLNKFHTGKSISMRYWNVGVSSFFPSSAASPLHTEWILPQRRVTERKKRKKRNWKDSIFQCCAEIFEKETKRCSEYIHFSDSDSLCVWENFVWMLCIHI